MPVLIARWYEALLKYFSARDIKDEERKLIDHILPADPEKLRPEVNQGEKKSQEIIQVLIHPTNIVDAGKSIKGVVYLVLIMILCTMIGMLIINNSNDIEILKNTYVFFGLVILVCNIIILFQLYSTGNNVESSVNRK